MATLARSASAGPVSDLAAATSVSLLGTAHICLIVGDIGVGGKGFETEKWEWRAGVPRGGDAEAVGTEVRRRPRSGARLRIAPAKQIN
jgi:hypothetical protein